MLKTKIILCVFLLVLQLGGYVDAHPADELCFDDSIDALLCAQLAELDRAEVTGSTLPEINLDRSALDTFSLYTQFGIDHILPFGVDHLAFLLALVLAAVGLRSLLIQISVFTLAHSLTLVLGVLGLVSLNSVFVEIAIAISIVFVAVENLFLNYKLLWRSFVIFAFGLLHGLGFAGALGELGIPNDHYISALFGFNVGVEIAQIGFGLVFFLLLHKALSRRVFDRYVYLPTNLLIAALGIFWVVQRSFF